MRADFMVKRCSSSTDAHGASAMAGRRSRSKSCCALQISPVPHGVHFRRLGADILFAVPWPVPAARHRPSTAEDRPVEVRRIGEIGRVRFIESLSMIRSQCLVPCLNRMESLRRHRSAVVTATHETIWHALVLAGHTQIADADSFLRSYAQMEGSVPRLPLHPSWAEQ